MKAKGALIVVLCHGTALINHAKLHDGGGLALPEVDDVPRPSLGRQLGMLDAAFNQGCKDSATFQLAYESKGVGTCARISANKKHRAKACKKGEVQQHCPVTCGVCGKSSRELCGNIKTKKRCWRLSCCTWRNKKKCYSRKPNKKCFAGSGQPTSTPTISTMDSSTDPSIFPSSAPIDSPSVEYSDSPSFSPSVKSSGPFPSGRYVVLTKKGGAWTCTRTGKKLFCGNPAQGYGTERPPAKGIVTGNKLRMFNFVGTWNGGTVSWTNDAVWDFEPDE